MTNLNSNLNLNLKIKNQVTVLVVGGAPEALNSDKVLLHKRMGGNNGKSVDKKMTMNRTSKSSSNSDP